MCGQGSDRFTLELRPACTATYNMPYIWPLDHVLRHLPDGNADTCVCTGMQVCFALQEADLVLLAGASGGKRSAGAIAVDVLAVLLIGQVHAAKALLSKREA